MTAARKERSKGRRDFPIEERSAVLAAVVVNLIQPRAITRGKIRVGALKPEARLTMTGITKWVSRYLSRSVAALPVTKDKQD